MGQPIQVETSVLDDIAIFHTDRSITGQDGVAFTAAQDAAVDDFPALLANRFFAEIDAVDHVFVASNDVVARRTSGWDGGSVLADATTIVEEFFVFYDGSQPVPEMEPAAEG